ncbi:hypothetical protein ILYODFUR_030855, partial [Ilyodon furcidens]
MVLDWTTVDCPSGLGGGRTHRHDEKLHHPSGPAASLYRKESVDVVQASQHRSDRTQPKLLLNNVGDKRFHTEPLQGGPSGASWEIMSKEYQMRAAINQKLIEMGERERLKELLRAKLVECGWKDQLKAHCKDVIREKGLEHVTVEDLVTEVTPKGR